MNSVQLYRNENPTITVPIDENTVLFDECMGRFDITLSTSSATPLDIKVDDYIIWDDVRFTVNVPFQLVRGAGFDYSITFEHPSRALNDIIFKHVGSVEFSFFGTPRSFVELIVNNMNEDDTGWNVGQCEEVEPKFADFVAGGSGYTCKGALSMVAELFQLEFWFSGDGKTVNLTKQAGQVTNIDFAYGQGKGLYSVERGMMDSSIPNRLLGFGGTQNLAQGYRGGFQKRLMFSPGYVERALLPGEKRREKTVIFDDIFPDRTGMITGVSSDWVKLTDTSIDFDLNGNAIAGEIPKVLFKSGMLGGREFEISYNHSSKTFRITPITESNGTVFPNSTFFPLVGDKYSFVGIEQPSSYVTNAEDRLKVATENSFKQLTRPPYRVEIDEKYMRENGFSLKSGDRVRLKDIDLGVDDVIRVTSVSFPLVNPQKCTIVISDKITYTQDVQFVIDQGKIKEEVKVVDKTLTEYNRTQSAAMSQFKNMVFDPDGGISETLQVMMIEAMAGVFGADSQNFDLEGVFIKANADNNPNKITFTAGKLVHYKYQIENIGATWSMGAYSKSDLVPTSPYYISAKCSKTQLTGEWVASTQPIGVDDITGFWHFNLGVISSVIDGQRFTNITKGFTYITGGQILTERLIAQFLKLPYITIGKDGKNAIEIWYDLAQTKLAMTLGVVNGKPQMIWYDETTGNEIWNASRNGIVYVTATPESWRTEGMLLLQSTPTSSTPLDRTYVTSILQLNANKIGNDVTINNDAINYYYEPGSNEQTEANSIYEGYHNTQVKNTSFIENGFYALAGIYPNGKKITSLGEDKYMAEVYRIWNGKIVGNTEFVEIYVP